MVSAFFLAEEGGFLDDVGSAIVVAASSFCFLKICRQNSNFTWMAGVCLIFRINVWSLTNNDMSDCLNVASAGALGLTRWGCLFCVGACQKNLLTMPYS
jgi:hypothetical protein